MTSPAAIAPTKSRPVSMVLMETTSLARGLSLVAHNERALQAPPGAAGL